MTAARSSRTLYTYGVIDVRAPFSDTSHPRGRASLAVCALTVDVVNMHSHWFNYTNDVTAGRSKQRSKAGNKRRLWSTEVPQQGSGTKTLAMAGSGRRGAEL